MTTYVVKNASTMLTMPLTETTSYGEACNSARSLSDELATPMHVISELAVHITFFPTINQTSLCEV